MEMASSTLVPETLPYTHTDEGRDDMPAHVKASIFGSSLTIPITRGKLNLGTWQGLYLLEHRNHASARNVVCTIYGN
jgi:secondary thiamine-phosphate synthase enzyme